MIFFVFTSAECNLSCTYCGNTPEDLCMPEKPTYDLSALISFVADDPDPVFVFYGGEPLLNRPYVCKVMDAFPTATFVLQTNGTLLYTLPTPYLLRITCILLSIDGRPETVDAYRGRGVFGKMEENIKDARERGYVGPVVARMACSMKTDIYEDVHYLAYDCPIGFAAVYWQLDVEWDSPMNIRWGDFEGWMRQKYMTGITRLFKEWCTHLEHRDIKVLVPFNTITEAYLDCTRISGADVVAPRKGYLRCSAGHKAVSVTTDGRVLACPVASGDSWNNLGKLTDKCCDLLGKRPLTGTCEVCEVREVCGGRCLYANQTLWWGDEGHALVCELNKHLIGLCEAYAPQVQSMLERGEIAWDDFFFPSERYSLEIIP
ncbi:AstB/chuR-related protein [Giardia muris]|uniref:AstB/chuR-related protein n=1 Tax=Giardia muris TaxID=5742 RepID=A0A4Z1SP93_GIAMU|nr:AstB/chuR-related protein [Giardia muris]|eukprot:TNJ27460.1 AstB/chuR-related protein [Giardia muris]